MPKPEPVSGGATGSESKNAGVVAACMPAADPPATATAAGALATTPFFPLCGAAGVVGAPPDSCSESSGGVGVVADFLASATSASLAVATAASLASAPSASLAAVTSTLAAARAAAAASLFFFALEARITANVSICIFSARSIAAVARNLAACLSCQAFVNVTSAFLPAAISLSVVDIDPGFGPDIAGSCRTCAAAAVGADRGFGECLFLR